MLDAYRLVVRDPAKYRETAASVAQLLLESGRGNDSLALIDRLVEYDARGVDRSALVGAMILQADGFRARKYSVATIAAYKRAERMLDTTGEPAQLSRCLEGQAHVLLEREDFDGALEKALAAEQAGRESGSVAILSRAIVTRAKILRRRKEADAALAALDEAVRLLRSVGNRAEMLRVLDEKHLALQDVGDHEGARDAAGRAGICARNWGSTESLSRFARVQRCSTFASTHSAETSRSTVGAAGEICWPTPWSSRSITGRCSVSFRSPPSRRHAWFR